MKIFSAFLEHRTSRSGEDYGIFLVVIEPGRFGSVKLPPSIVEILIKGGMELKETAEWD